MTKEPAPTNQLRTVDVEPDEFSLVKPGELVDVVELSPLTLQDRRVYNLLILNAWPKITEPIEHCIRKRDMRGSHHTNERVGDSVERLMGAIARVKVVRDGKTYTRRVQLLAPTDESDEADGLLYYSFNAGLRAIIKHSSQFARLQKDVMFSFSSKYALALYEMVQKRGNLKHKTSEEFSVDNFRALLGVEKGKLTLFKHFKYRAIDPAVSEVNSFGEFGCKVEPILSGRKVVGIRLSWWPKTLEQKKAVIRELRVSRVGRPARLRDTIETVAVDHSACQPALVGRNGLTPAQFENLRARFPGIDIEELERQFVAWNAERRTTPDNYPAALCGFIRRKLESLKT